MRTPSGVLQYCGQNSHYKVYTFYRLLEHLPPTHPIFIVDTQHWIDGECMDA